MSTALQKTLEDFIQIQNRNAISHTIRAAVELGVIRALTAGQRTLEQLSEELDVNPEVLRRLMAVLVTTELVEQYHDDYALSQVGRLTPERFLDFGDQHWQHLAAHVKSGTSLPASGEIPVVEADYLMNKAAQEWMLTPIAMAVSEILDMGETRTGQKVLEIGCGSAVFGVTLVHGDADGRLTLLDSEVGLSQARQTAKSIGLDSRVTFIASDTWNDLSTVSELDGATFDLVLVAGQIHRRSPEQCKQFFDQVYRLVKPDGELVLIDVFPGQEEGDTHRALFELELGLRTSTGQLHDPEEVEALLKESGFGRIQYSHLPSAPFYWGLMLAQR